jgi:HPt (histidine-containing phosphotransfer) domain-containing protein
MPPCQELVFMKPDRKISDLKAALKRMGGNVTILQQLVEYYREDVPPLIERLRAGIAANNPAEIQQAAHSIKGLVVNFDADSSARAALQLEQMARSRDLIKAPHALDALEKEIARLNADLEVELPKLQ